MTASLIALLTLSSAGLGATAQVGAQAPDFSLTSLDGKVVSLNDYRGKTVVLEWFNPQCPYVVASHSKGSLVDTAKRHGKKGVVWLAINSGAPGKQGHGKSTNLAGKERFGMQHPILMDEDGKVGRAYGATRTPHMFVIDKTGKLVYAGAVDNAADGAGEMPEGGKLVNYVDAALADLAQGRPVRTPKTKEYGCSVKYGH